MKTFYLHLLTTPEDTIGSKVVLFDLWKEPS